MTPADDILDRLVGLGIARERAADILAELGPALARTFVDQVRRHDRFDHGRRRTTVPIADLILYRFRLARARGG